MKKYYYVLFILIFSSLGLNAETTNTKLNELFIQLKECNSQKQSKILENKIWRLWETHPTNFQLTMAAKARRVSRLAKSDISPPKALPVAIGLLLSH